MEPFNDAVDSQDLRREWEEWLRAFELTLELRNYETQHEKLVFLLASGGRGLQRIFYNLRPTSDEIYPAPVRVPLMPIEIPEYDNAVKRLNRFFIGKRNERIELEVFRSIKQTADETINQFLLRLRAQAARCDFFEREEKEILQQITMGARDERVRDKGLEDVMSLDELINYAVNREVLLKQKGKARPFSEDPSTTAATVNQIRTKRQEYTDRSDAKNGPTVSYRQRMERRGQAECSRCGSSYHRTESTNCYARNARCNSCGKLGHFSRKCRSTGNARATDRRYQQRYRPYSEMNTVHREDVWKEESQKHPATDQSSKVSY